MTIRSMRAGLLPALCLALAAGQLVAEAGAAELRLATGFPPTHLMQVHMTGPWAKELERRSNETLTVRFHPGGELGAAPTLYRRAVDGVADISFSLQGYTSDQFPRTLLIEIPGLADDNQSATRMLWRAIDLIQPDYAEVKVLALWTVGPYIVMTRRTPVRTVEDMRGLRLRTPSKLLGELLTALGASPVSLAIGEIYHALQTGVIDGQLTGASAIEGFKFGEVQKYYTENVRLGLQPLFLVMNRRAYDRLSAEHRALIDETTGLELSLTGAQVYDREAVRQLENEIKSGRGERIVVAPAELERFEQATRPVGEATINQLEAQGIPARKIVETMKAGS